MTAPRTELAAAARALVAEHGFDGARQKVARMVAVWKMSDAEDAAAFVEAWSRIATAIDSLQRDQN